MRAKAAPLNRKRCNRFQGLAFGPIIDIVVGSADMQVTWAEEQVTVADDTSHLPNAGALLLVN